MPLKLFTSNKLESLVDLLSQSLAEPLSDPFREETILVQSKGMERWISMRLAESVGIWANAYFPFPNTFVEEMFERIIPEMSADPVFRPENLMWRIMSLLPDLLDRPEFATIADYLSRGEQNLKLYQLSSKLADLFDQYMVYRPDMIEAWENQQPVHWQHALWRILIGKTDGAHRVSLRNRLIEKLGAGEAPPGQLPPRLSVFGISVLPPFHLQIIETLSAHIEVNIFLMNPSNEYWADIVSDREMMRRTVDEKRAYTTGELHLERGNSLLASMGSMGRDFFAQIEELEVQSEEFFEQPVRHSLLTCIQSDIFHLREETGETEDAEPKEIDRSIQIHSCHSPMREVEVLHDRILGLLDDNQSLEPEEILVMAPNINDYAPLVQAVFGDPGMVKIPYNISDRSVEGTSGAIRTFLSLLDLPEHRFSVLKVMDVLESEPVRRKLGLDEGGLEAVRSWLSETRIHWGIDSEERERQGLPATDQNTWRAGLDRLLLGYSLQGDRPFRDILPFESIEGQTDTDVLGVLAPFMERLFRFGKALEESRSLAEWGGLFSEILAELFDPRDQEEPAAEDLRNLFVQLVRSEANTGYHEPVGLGVVVSHLRSRLALQKPRLGFLSGGITFCSMLPMRSIPFKVICLLGMNEGAYPKAMHSLEFDLMRAGPARPGDRSRRLDDRYLFLETLLSAREVLYISYIGRDIRDNTVLPPSVLVSELLDYAEWRYTQTDGGSTGSGLRIDHPLQAYSERYFCGEAGMFSYSEENLQACEVLGTPAGEPDSLFEDGISAPPEVFKDLSLDELYRFYRNPVKYLLTRRLEILLEPRDVELEDRECFILESLDRYLVDQEILESVLAGQDQEEHYTALRAEGSLPHGLAGQVTYRDMRKDAQVFAGLYSDLDKGQHLDPVTVNLSLEGYRISGFLDLWEEGQFLYRYAKLRATDVIKAWIYHLVYSVLGGGSGRTVFLAKNDKISFEPVEEPTGHLGQLLHIYWAGLIRPLAFFPETSLKYAERLCRGSTVGKALKGLAGSWSGSPYHMGEGQDPYYRLVFGENPPLGEAFQNTAVEVFGPLLGCRQSSGRRGR